MVYHFGWLSQVRGFSTFVIFTCTLKLVERYCFVGLGLLLLCCLLLRCLRLSIVVVTW